MAELVDAHDSKSCEEIHVGSSPTMGTRLIVNSNHKSLSFFEF